jgi:DNA polymerase (family 10)
LDNAAIARALRDIADLLEIKGENPFKIRAYRTAADLASDMAEPLATLDEAALRALPGIGRDLAIRIHELAATGRTPVLEALLEEFPSSILDLLRLQGVGPKTVARLYYELAIDSLPALEQAARDGRIRALKGMGSRKEALMLKALEDQRRYAGRHLLADATDVAGTVTTWLATRIPDVEFVPVGSLRRGMETCGDIDILALGDAPGVMPAFTSHPGVERILGQGDTKSSVVIAGGCQVDLRLVAGESRGAALQYFTGSKAHNIALRDRALERGWRLNEYGLFRASDGARLAGETEEGVYERLGLQWIPPELREHRGELALAEAGRLPDLIEESDLRGDLHMHTTETDGRDDLDTMVRAAAALGLEYIAVTEHSRSLAMANGLDERRALAHAARIRALDRRMDGLRVMAGIECDILPDGRLDLADDCLAELDLVIASVHSSLQQDEAEMTDRMLRAIEHPLVDIVGHATGRLLLKRPGVRFRLDAVIDRAAALGVAFEINCQVDRLDLSDAHARLAHERGASIVICSDAHAAGALALRRWGIVVARRAGLSRQDVLNTRPFKAFRAGLRRYRPRRPL